MKEIYKDIKGFGGLYRVSNLGRVKSLNYKRTGRERILKCEVDNNGYHRVLLRKNGKTCNKYIHRLVAGAFIPNPNNLECVNHINGIKTDNRIENLEFCTCRENNIHAVKTGLRKEFTSEKKPVYCPELNIDFESINDAARYFNCTRNTIHHILKGRMKHLRKKYTFMYK